MTFLEVLEKIEQNSDNTVDKGTQFERLIQRLLQTTPVYGCNDERTKVYLWNEWPHRNQFAGHDSGIDLVVEKENGEFIAVQCKFHRNRIHQEEIDSFVATTGKSFYINENKCGFSSGLLFITHELTKTAEQLIENQNPPITKVTQIKMDDLGVNWEELYYGNFGRRAKEKRKKIRDYQIEAVQKTHEHFKNHDRGKLIMACGTGKTFTSLCIATKETGGKGLVLFLAPSIALVGQTLRKWMVDADEGVNIHPLCVCSDPSVGKRKKEEDHFDDSISSIDCLVSTDSEATAAQIRKFTEEFPNDLTVVFSTYQSIEVIHEAQEILREKDPEKFEFDLTICDEAHRTTGKVLESESVSYFNLVHISEYIKSKRRLYMTATPRLYEENLKKEAKNQGIYLWSMDDEEQFGEEIYRLGFGEAVKRNLLADYKVIILTISKSSLPKEIRFSDNGDDSELSTDDCTKLVGCIEALSKNVVTENG
ncbi:DEAD/DEAH box helicase family protein, partial [bacterium]|nr:DEAD/DEAH box helicase family protein [bacterium]